MFCLELLNRNNCQTLYNILINQSKLAEILVEELPVKEVCEIPLVSKIPPKAQVNEKPVLVANIPEKSKWERETDSDNDLKLRTKDRRMATEKNLVSK